MHVGREIKMKKRLIKRYFNGSKTTTTPWAVKNVPLLFFR